MTDWKNFSCEFYLQSDFLPGICWETVVEEIFFIFCFERDVWPEDLNKILQIKILGKGDFRILDFYCSRRDENEKDLHCLGKS